jgi:predicted PurR-regulated permease PerM
VLILLVSLFLVKPYITALISAVLLAYIFYPLYNKIKFVVRNENVAALITTGITIIIIVIPLIFAANALINQSIEFFYTIRDIDVAKIEKITEGIIKNNINLEDHFKSILNTLSLSIAKTTSDFVVSIPGRILQFFVMLFVMFYLFKEGPQIVSYIMEHLPMREAHKRHIMKKFSGVVYASLYVLVLTAFIQGAVGALGLWIFDVPSPILWGLVMVVLSMLPFVGAAFVWFPAALYKIFTNDTFNGVGLLLYGLFIVSTIDNIIRPKIVGSKGKIHPVLVLLGVLGGIKMFGFLGIILGPLILAILVVFMDIYILERTHQA